MRKLIRKLAIVAIGWPLALMTVNIVMFVGLLLALANVVGFYTPRFSLAAWLVQAAIKTKGAP